MNYSVVIPAYNAATTILACLHAVTHQQFDEPYEVLVVDSSNDATPELIRQHFPQVTLIHLDQRTDAGIARNIGIQHARGEILCLIDSDCVADPAWLRNMAAAHQEDYAAVGGAILNGNPDNLTGWAGYLAEFREFFPYRPRAIVRHAATCNISYKRRVFERYGQFPANFYPQEDLVFNFRFDQEHDAILFDPMIRVSHCNKSSARHFFLHQYRIGRITAHVLRRFELPGTRIARSRWLAVLAAPLLLPCVKFFNTLRVAARSRKYAWFFLLVSPLLLAGLFVWGVGFARGAFLPLRPMCSGSSPI